MAKSENSNKNNKLSIPGLENVARNKGRCIMDLAVPCNKENMDDTNNQENIYNQLTNWSYQALIKHGKPQSYVKRECL